MSVRVGIDLTSVDEVVEALATHGDRYLRRVFTVREVDDCRDADGVVDPQRLAARFAAKEAVMKALGVGLGAFAFRDVEVVKAPSGAPSLSLSGRAADLAARRGVRTWHLSLTHSGLVAEAVAVAL